MCFKVDRLCRVRPAVDSLKCLRGEEEEENQGFFVKYNTM